MCLFSVFVSVCDSVPVSLSLSLSFSVSQLTVLICLCMIICSSVFLCVYFSACPWVSWFLCPFPKPTVCLSVCLPSLYVCRLLISPPPLLSSPTSLSPDRLVGLVVRRPPRERKIPGSNPACAGIFSWSSHTSDLNIGTPVATLPGAWRYRVSAGTGRRGVSIL